MIRMRHSLPGVAVAMALMISASGARAQNPLPATQQGPTYADLADFADSAPLVARAKIRKMARVPPERATGVAAGQGRFFVTATTQALLTGGAPLGAEQRYLVDLPLDARGRAPKLKNASVLLFARPVPQRPGELQLVAPDAQVLWSPEAENRVRQILYELVAPDAPARITGVREAIYVAGTLRGEGETQIFLSTANGSAAALTVQHRPGSPPAWGASFSEVVGDVGNPPQQGTLAWYRLACFLPNALPRHANLSDTAAGRAQAEADYRMVLGELGPCGRSRR